MPASAILPDKRRIRPDAAYRTDMPELQQEQQCQPQQQPIIPRHEVAGQLKDRNGQAENSRKTAHVLGPGYTKAQEAGPETDSAGDDDVQRPSRPRQRRQRLRLG